METKGEYKVETLDGNYLGKYLQAVSYQDVNGTNIYIVYIEDDGSVDYMCIGRVKLINND